MYSNSYSELLSLCASLTFLLEGFSSLSSLVFFILSHFYWHLMISIFILILAKSNLIYHLNNLNLIIYCFYSLLFCLFNFNHQLFTLTILSQDHFMFLKRNYQLLNFILLKILICFQISFLIFSTFYLMNFLSFIFIMDLHFSIFLVIYSIF